MFVIPIISSVWYNSLIKKHEREVCDMPTTGEKPGKGEYTCSTCGQTVILDDDTDTLPPCPKCNGTDYN